MNRFRGTYTYSLDDKGRISIPAKFRKCLSPEADETFVICQGPDKCLRAYPQNTWNKYEDSIASRPENPETAQFKRLLYKTVSDSTLDSQGRVMITDAQRAIAGIEKSVLLIGQNEYMELWDPTRYDAYFGSEPDFDKMFYKSVETSPRTSN